MCSGEYKQFASKLNQAMTNFANNEGNSIARVNGVDAVKLVALVSIIAAHIDIKSGDASSLLNLKTGYYFFGSIGVGLFFAILGMRSADRNGIDVNSMKRVIRYYCVPWVFSGTIIYSYLLIRKPELDIKYIEFLLGNGSYLYFMPVYIIFLMLAPSILKHRSLRIVLLLVSLLYCLNGRPMMPINVSEYFNLLLWIPYIVFGFTLKFRRPSLAEALKTPEFFLIMVFAGLSLFAFGDNLVERIGLNYQSPFLIFIVCFVFLCIVRIKISNDAFVLKDLCENTLFIYLWHMPLVGALSSLANKYSPYLFWVMPLAVLLGMWLMIKLGQYIIGSRTMRETIALR